MSCPQCENSNGLLQGYPFELVETLLREPYSGKGAFIHQCKSCASKYIGVTVQAYDENLSYWAKASDEELQLLSKFKNTQDIFRKSKELIQSKGSHIFGAHDGKYYYRQEGAVVLSDMPPW